MKTKVFKEAEFDKRMDSEVRDFLISYVKNEQFISFDNTNIQVYYAVNPNPKAAITMVHGFTEYWERYQEIAYYFFNEGYSIFFIENRGHGHSGRVVPEMSKVHVNDFDEYIEDLRVYMDRLVNPYSEGLKHILYCHSMGGCIGGLFLEKYPTEYFDFAILSSPMLGINYGGLDSRAVKALYTVSRGLRWSTNWGPLQKPFNPDAHFEDACSQSEARYNRDMRRRRANSFLQMSGCDYAWWQASVRATEKVVKEAGKVTIPVLIYQAGLDTLVTPEAQNEFAKRAANVKLITFPDSKHEIMNGTDDIVERYFNSLMDWIEETLKTV